MLYTLLAVVLKIKAMNDKIKDLQRQIEAEKNKMNNCSHEWGEGKSNPETKREPYGHRMVTQGSDVWGEPEGYRDVTVPRWTRVCALCGKEEHTYKQKPIVKGYEADF